MYRAVDRNGARESGTVWDQRGEQPCDQQRKELNVFTQSPCAQRNSESPITQQMIDAQDARMNRLVQPMIDGNGDMAQLVAALTPPPPTGTCSDLTNSN